MKQLSKLEKENLFNFVVSIYEKTHARVTKHSLWNFMEIKIRGKINPFCNKMRDVFYDSNIWKI